MTKVARFDPLTELHALQKQLLGNDWVTPPKGVSLPTTDVYMRGDKELITEAHLPNFKKDNVDIHLENGTLIVQAEKKEEKEEADKKRYFLRESSDSFYRTVRLPKDADADHIEAQFEDGVLRVTVPIKEAPKPKKITVKQRASRTKAASPKK